MAHGQESCQTDGEERASPGRLLRRGASWPTFLRREGINQKRGRSGSICMCARGRQPSANARKEKQTCNCVRPGFVRSTRVCVCICNTHARARPWYCDYAQCFLGQSLCLPALSPPLPAPHNASFICTGLGICHVLWVAFKKSPRACL